MDRTQGRRFAAFSAVLSALFACAPQSVHRPVPSFSLQDLRNPANQLYLTHYLESEAEGSLAIASYLVRRKAIAGLHEKVVWVGNRSAMVSELESAGFSLAISQADIVRGRLPSARLPQFAVLDEEGRTLWAGEYSKGKRGPQAYRDLLALREARPQLFAGRKE